MSNSSLANYINRFSGSYTTRTELISKITIHTAGKKGDCYDLAELLMSTSDTSYHYGIATDGTIGLYVDEQYATYSTGNEYNDQRAINIILMNSTDNSVKMISQDTYNALIKLCVDICRRNYILNVTYLPNNRSASTLTMHSWYKNVDCPGSWVGNRYQQIANDINTQLSKAQTAISESEALKSQSTIATGAINPYMVTPNDDAIGIDYMPLKNKGVIGVMLHAGAYFYPNHVKVPKYINSHLKTQVSEVSAANLPFALYATVRAKTVAEAKQECYELYFVVSKYPPKLGLWLHLDFGGLSPNRMREIVDVYYDKIVKWGLKNKCGLYCTPSVANALNWPQYTDKFALWLISPLNNVSNLEQLLTPSLFKL